MNVRKRMMVCGDMSEYTDNTDEGVSVGKRVDG